MTLPQGSGQRVWELLEHDELKSNYFTSDSSASPFNEHSASPCYVFLPAGCKNRAGHLRLGFSWSEGPFHSHVGLN